MGIVLEATHLHLDERVALKFLRRQAGADPNILSRFSAEARAAAKLRSEHVARVFDVGTFEGMPFMVMELLEGTDVGAELEVGRLPMAVAVDYIIQAIDGISEAHAAGIVHRDLKPENLFLAKQRGGLSRLKVLDFGISKAALTEASEVVSSHETTSLLGSPHYMSPEQLRSTKTVDHRADVWSLGVVLFEMLTACHPFDETLRCTFTELVAKILEQPHLRLRSLEPDLPEELERIIDVCLEKAIDKRVQTAAELGVLLLPFATARSHAIVERALAVTKASSLAHLVEGYDVSESFSSQPERRSLPGLREPSVPDLLTHQAPPAAPLVSLVEPGPSATPQSPARLVTQLETAASVGPTLSALPAPAPTPTPRRTWLSVTIVALFAMVCVLAWLLIRQPATAPNEPGVNVADAPPKPTATAVTSAPPKRTATATASATSLATPDVAVSAPSGTASNSPSVSKPAPAARPTSPSRVPTTSTPRPATPLDIRLSR